MELNFTTKIAKKDINLIDKNSPTVAGDITLKWYARIVADNHKISDIVAYVPDQEVSLTIEVEVPNGPDDFDTEEKETILKIADVEIEYERGEVSDSRALGLMPVEINLYKGKWTVKFVAYSV